MSPSEIATLKFFCLNTVEFVTFNQIFSILWVSGGFAPEPHTPTQGSVPVWTLLLTEPILFSPSETNYWLGP